jgi:hypothetical protein
VRLGELATSAMDSAYAQKYGGLCDQPMGNVRGRAIKDFSMGTSDGIMTARCRTASGAMGTR